MKFNSKIFVFAAFCCLIFSLSAFAQKTRKKPTPRTAQTAKVSAPQNFEPQVVSTAEEMERDENSAGTFTRNGATGEQPTVQPTTPPKKLPTTRETVEALATQVQELTNKISNMEAQQRSLLDLERLSRAEQRAEQIRKQLDEVIEKQGTLQARIDQIEYEVKPENIERNAALFGSLRPEEIREQRRKSLESEKARLQIQLNQARDSQNRLEISIKNADDLVVKLQKKVEDGVDLEETPQVSKPKVKKEAPTDDEGNN